MSAHKENEFFVNWKPVKIGRKFSNPLIALAINFIANDFVIQNMVWRM